MRMLGQFIIYESVCCPNYGAILLTANYEAAKSVWEKSLPLNNNGLFRCLDSA